MVWQLPQLSLVRGCGVRVAKFLPPTKMPLWQVEQALGMMAAW